MNVYINVYKGTCNFVNCNKNRAGESSENVSGSVLMHNNLCICHNIWSLMKKNPQFEIGHSG